MRFLGLALVRPAILAFAFASPAAAPSDGGLYLYLQPLPVDAGRLTFTIASASAIAATGEESPLRLNLTSVGAAQAGRQRLLASGRLPFGSYAAVTLRVTAAALNDGNKRAALTVPDAPIRLSLPLAIGTQPTVVWLTLRYQDSITGGMGFSPAFSIDTPPRPIADHVGFVSNTASNTLTVFDKHLTQAIAVIDTCAAPSGMALDQQRRRLYVACTKDDEVRSIDVATGEVVERSRVSPGDRPRELALTPDGRTLIAVNTGSNSISFYDALSLVRGERINVGSGPSFIVIDSAGRRGFVLNTLSSSLSVIDVAGRTALTTVSLESAPLRARLDPRSDRLFVIHERSPYMTVLDSRQLTTIARARLRVAASAIAIDAVRDLVCLGSDTESAVEFYDPRALMPLFTLRAKSAVSYLAVDAEDNTLYMVGTAAKVLSVARLTNRTLASEIDVGDAPYAVAVMGER
jgi:YVTN family beta-propeller protein